MKGLWIYRLYLAVGIGAALALAWTAETWMGLGAAALCVVGLGTSLVALDWN